MSRYRRVRFRDLGPAEIGAWAAAAESCEAVSSPYFRPEFAGAVDAERGDVVVTVIEEDGRAAGFFPHHRRGLGEGRPLALGISDFHGVIAPPRVEWSMPDLLAASRLSSFRFDHALAEQPQFAACAESSHSSPVIDLSGGYGRYIEGRKASGSKQVQKVEGLARKMEREVGPVRFVLEESDPAVLDRVIRWKSEQCRAAGTVDVFAVDWTRNLMRRLMATRSPGFAGVLSALYVGDSLAAAHMGMRSRTVWHYWFPAYDEAFAKYSTGLLLLLRLAESAAAGGAARVDLGKGESMYKQRLMSGASTVLEGRAEIPSAASSMRRWRRGAEKWAGSAALGAPVRLAFKALARWERSRKFT